jgi:hypothetical protein
MGFGAPDGSTRKLHQGFSFELPPSSSPVVLAKKREDSDTGSSRNRFNVSNVSKNLKVRPIILSHTPLNKPGRRLTSCR